MNILRASIRGSRKVKFTLLLLGLSWLHPSAADIYTYTDNDGRVYLSDTPENMHYEMLVSGPGTPAAETLLAKKRKSSSRISRKIKYDRMIEEVARTYGLDSALLHAVVTVESSYNPNAISKQGAAGLMQLMPSIARHYGVEDSLDPVQNLHGGAKYLRDMMILFNSNMSLAVAAYNAGETAVVRHGNRIPPFRETMNYVPKVMNFYREYRADRRRSLNNLAVKRVMRPLMPGGPSPSRAGKGYGNVFPLRENL